ncbi:MAG: HAD family hydrolase [bacterium]|nr:HAD family hydrolase [Candidatus Wildermuthbacteria bacterium]MDP2664877.1 HAD family hydrolase [bacterium]
MSEPKAFGPNKIQHIALDVDDTLIPTDGNIPEGYDLAFGKLRSLMRLADQGHFPPTGFCSGREDGALRETGYSLGRPNVWSVTEGGLTLWNSRTEELLYNPNIPPESPTVLKTIRETVIPQFVIENPFLVLYHGKRVNIALELQPGSPLSIRDLFEKVSRVLQGFVEKELIVITYSSVAVDIAPVGVSKATGIKFLSQKTGINPAQLLFMGDSRGDFSAFQVAGFVGCPSNASNECKDLVTQRGGRISPYPYAQGVVDIIRHFVGGF